MKANLRYISHDKALLGDIEQRYFNSLSDEIIVGGKNFIKKEEFHITLINGIKSFTSYITEEQKNTILDQKEIYIYLEKLSKKEVSFSLTDDIRHLKREDRESCVQMIDSAEILDLMQCIERDISGILDIPLVFEKAPLHITLYTLKNNPKAIGLYSQRDLERFSL